MTHRTMRLGAFLHDSGHHSAAWRHPQHDQRRPLELDYWKQLAVTAERGKFDSIFLADTLGFSTHDLDLASRKGSPVGFEPLTLLSVLSTVTQHIGLIATASATYNEPYHIARKFASLDHLSGGRAGWNVVTSFSDEQARNFNRDQNMEHALRYERAEEAVGLVRDLWDSWDDDALNTPDRRNGVFFSPSSLHVTGHVGKHFKVNGPLNLPRPPQGHPVVVQAGSSDAGRELAARQAEVVYTSAQSLDAAQAFYRDVKGRMGRYGRDPDSLKIMPGAFTMIGESEAQAREKFEELQELLDLEVGRTLLEFRAGGFSLKGYDLDGPLPDLPETNGGKGRRQQLLDTARAQNLTLRQLIHSFVVVRAHRLVLGTPVQVADQLEEWFTQEGADGFNIAPTLMPQGLHEFVDHVVPELQRRGLFRTEYEGRTLRENLGLARPANRFGRATGGRP